VVLRALIDTRTLENTAYEPLGPVALENRFVCRDGVEARRLLVITRNDLLREAEELYSGNAICDEAWRIRILKRGKGNLYNVYVSQECICDRMVPDLPLSKVHYQGQAVIAGKQPKSSQPVSLEQAEGVALGLMTIIKKQDIYTTYQE